ncbi:MAG: FkbM family methyltransferase [Verrucomicrobiae bacterium]|nr:FkbM family methyltransferase [Verrucomicrobiae bacterium]
MKNLLRKMRRTAFEFVLPDGRTVGDVVLQPLLREHLRPLVVDVGARNGMQMLPSGYAQNARLIGFEPNPEEHRKLVSKTTDAHKINAPIPVYQNEVYHPYALWDSAGTHQFHITTGPGACTLMGPTITEVTEHMYMDYPDSRREKSFEQLHTKVKESIQVPCCKLDDILGSDEVCDFLKLDVEGAELRCLRGAERTLSEKRILFIYTEFVALPFYAEHCTLGDLHVFLAGKKYRLLDMDRGHQSYRREARDLPESADRRLLHAGDAFFCLDPDTNTLSPRDKQRMAALCLIFEFNSFALSLLREAGLTGADDLNRIEQVISSTYTVNRLKKIWAQLPTTIARILRGH